MFVHSILISSFHKDDLTGSQRIVTGITLLYSLLQERRRVRIDYDCRPRLEIVHGLPDLHWIVVEKCRIHCHETQVVPRFSRRYHLFRGLRD